MASTGAGRLGGDAQAYSVNYQEYLSYTDDERNEGLLRVCDRSKSARPYQEGDGRGSIAIVSRVSDIQSLRKVSTSIPSPGRGVSSSPAPRERGSPCDREGADRVSCV